MARMAARPRVAQEMSSKSEPRVARVKTVPRVVLAQAMPRMALAQATPRVARPERRAAIQSAAGEDLCQQWCLAQERRGPAHKGRREDLQGTEVTS